MSQAAEDAAYGFSDRTAAEVSRLYALGYNLIPLGNGDLGKSPSVKFGGRKRLPLGVVLDRMRAENSAMYGVRLPGLLVIDIDTDTPPARELVARRFGNSPVQVRTSRGLHHWYRLGASRRPTNIVEALIRIDFKAGAGSYVAGPHAIRRDGAIYLPGASALDAARSLPVFTDKFPDPVRQQPDAPKIPVGRRNHALFQRAREYAPCVDSLDELLGDLLAIRNIQCDDPETVRDEEVVKIAGWAWKLRLENRLWSGRNSVLQINRIVIDKLQNVKHGTEAFMLHAVLVSAHGHIPGKTFAIVPEAMIASGLLTALSRDRIYRAKDILIEHGLLLRVARRINLPSLYQLASPSAWGDGAEVFPYIVTGFPGTGKRHETATDFGDAA